MKLMVLLLCVFGLMANGAEKRRLVNGTMLMGNSSGSVEYLWDKIDSNDDRKNGKYIRIQNQDVELIRVISPTEIVERDQERISLLSKKDLEGADPNKLSWLIVRYTDLEKDNISYLVAHDKEYVEARFVLDLRYYESAVTQGTIEVAGSMLVDVARGTLVAISVMSYDDSQWLEMAGRKAGLLDDYAGSFARAVVEPTLASYFSDKQKMSTLVDQILKSEIRSSELGTGLGKMLRP